MRERVCECVRAKEHVRVSASVCECARESVSVSASERACVSECECLCE